MRAVLVAALVAACGPIRPADPPAPARQPALASEDIEYFRENTLMVPVDGVSPRELRDTFNAPRAGNRTHGALDILAPRGTPVLAAIDGTVLRLTGNPAGGITAYLVDSGDRYLYYYAHLESYASTLAPGMRVKQGDVIGYVGTTGNAPPDTPHLHFQVMRPVGGRRDWWNGTPIDVRSLIARTGKARR